MGWGLTVNFPIDWFDRAFGKLANGEVRLRNGERIKIKGSYFEVALISKDQITLRRTLGTKITKVK